MSAKRDPQLLFLVGINLVVLLAGAVMSRGAFIDPYNLQSMAGQLPELGLLAMGVMLAMSSGNGGIDLSGDSVANDSRLFLAKTAVAQLMSAYPEIDFALARYHQDQALNRSCQTAKWLECQGTCCSYDNPKATGGTGPTSCTLTLTRNDGTTFAQAVQENYPLAGRCINYAGTCGSPRRGADILVGFESDVRQYISWLDGERPTSARRRPPAIIAAGSPVTVSSVAPGRPRLPSRYARSTTT